MDLAQHRSVFQWMFNQQAEQTIGQAAATIQVLAKSDVLLVKAMDGQQWMSVYDPLSADSLETFIARSIGGNGVRVIPWAVPTQADDGHVHAMLQAVGDGDLVLDLEPYPQFWQGGDFNGYLDNLIGYGPAPDDYHAWVSIDPRTYEQLNIEDWADRVWGFLPQFYWPDFSQNPWPCVQLLDELVTLLQADRLIPVLSDAASAQDMRLFNNIARSYGCSGVSLWRLGAARAQQLQAFGGLTIGLPT